MFLHHPFALLSDFLARRGIATLRYDDRGTAQSTGVFSEGTTADFADDAEGSAGTAAMTRDEAHRIAKAIAMIPEMRTIIRTLQDGLAEAEGGAPEG